MDGIRRLGLRWWRRNLLRTFLRRRENSCPLGAATQCPLTLARRKPDEVYTWKNAQGVKKRGHQLYRKQATDLRLDERVAYSLEMASDGLRQAGGLHCRDDPSYISGW